MQQQLQAKTKMAIADATEVIPLEVLVLLLELDELLDLPKIVCSTVVTT